MVARQKKGKIRLKLNRKFYDKGVVEEALKDFKDICYGNILNNNLEIELKTKVKIADIKGEFCNYVLGLMKNKNLV
jgi:hypothetical protein